MRRGFTVMLMQIWRLGSKGATGSHAKSPKYTRGKYSPQCSGYATCICRWQKCKATPRRRRFADLPLAT